MNEKRPNVVFVLTDDQGYGDLGRNGNPVIQTPNLDRMYDEGAHFDRELVLNAADIACVRCFFRADEQQMQQIGGLLPPELIKERPGDIAAPHRQTHKRHPSETRQQKRQRQNRQRFDGIRQTIDDDRPAALFQLEQT